VAEDMKVLSVVLDRRLTFHKHVLMVARSCNYHVQAIRHIKHLLTTELAQTSACSLILCRIDHCNDVLSRPTEQHYRETTESSEKCSSDCAPGVEVIPRQAVTAPAAPVASPAADHIQVGSSDTQRSHGPCATFPPNFVEIS